jgi:drug/metabolite transporter (DMT)-like permease
MSRLTANLGLLLAAAIWGGGFIAQSNALAHLGGAWFTGLRYILAFLFILPLGVLEARRVKTALSVRQILLLLPLGLVFLAGTTLQQWALESTSVTHVGFLTGLYVIFVPVLETLFLRRLPHPAIWLAAVVALMGTGCLGGDLSALAPGDVMTVLAALCFAFQIIILDRFVPVTYRPVLASLVQSLSCILLGCAIGAATGPVSWPSIRAAGPELLYAGLLSGGVAFVLQAMCQRYTQATDAAVMLMSESLFAALFAALLLGERLPPRGWLGCALLVASLILAQFGPALKAWRGRLKTA